MRLTIFERIVIVELLPKQSDFLTMMRIDEARKLLMPTEQEAEIVKLKNTGNGQIFIDQAFDFESDVNIGEFVSNVISNELKWLDESKGLRLEHLSLYEKFVENKQADKV